MSQLNNMFKKLKPMALPSARERAGSRVPWPYSSSEIAAMKNFRDDSPEDYEALVNGAIDNGLKSNDVPDGTQLNLFATSGPEAFGDYLDSDAVTEMDMQDISDLDTQFALANPEAVSEIGHALPEVLESVGDSNNIQGMEAFANLAPAISTAGKLARLYAMLSPILK